MFDVRKCEPNCDPKQTYLIYRNGIFYYSRRVPADLHKCFNKDHVIIFLRIKSQDKAHRSAKTLSDRLERYWESLPLELFHSRELDLRGLEVETWRLLD